jgi:Holliday junction DNA helicase RuvA
MIARLHGLLAEIGEEDAVVDVSGVGYLVRCSSRTLSRMPQVGEEVLLHIETLQGEQTGIRLVGFLTREERRAFVLLQGVQGVGPKAALAVLDVASPGELAQAIAREDKALVGRAQGVGPKLAQRIVVELKDKPIGDGTVAAFHGQAAAPAQPVVTLAGEAVAALMGLGVAEVVARRAVEQAVLRLGEDADAAAVIKAALQEMGR